MQLRFAAAVFLSAFFSVVLCSGAWSQSLSGVSVGNAQAALKQLLVDPISTEYFGNHATAMFRLSDGNELSATYLNSTGQVVYAEKDWISGSAGDATDFDDFKFGKTTLDEVRNRFGSKGIRFKGKPTAEVQDGKISLSSSFEIEGKAIVVTFVTTISSQKIEELRTSYGETRLYDHASGEAVLSAIILADRDYLASIWGPDRQFDNNYKQIAWVQGTLPPRKRPTQPSLSLIKTSQFPVDQIYRGTATLPELTGVDSEYETYRARIRGGMANGPNFAGHYTVIQIGCGPSCSFAIVGDDRSGEISRFPLGGDTNNNMTLRFEVGSELMVVQWSDKRPGRCYVQLFQFSDGNWTDIVTQGVGPAESCAKPIESNLVQATWPKP